MEFSCVTIVDGTFFKMIVGEGKRKRSCDQVVTL